MADSIASRASPAVYWRRIAIFLEAIKFEHSVFALPFAVLSAFLVIGGVPDGMPFLWVMVAMVSGRTLGMAANRLIDAEIDSRNPRTAGRALPAGLLSKRNVAAWMVVSTAIFGFAVSQLEPLAWRLAPVVVAVLVLYPYAKRFTWLSHFALGLIYLIVPPATWIALTGEIPAGAVLLGVAGMFWVAGFDIVYATADVAVDRSQGLQSIPARFGIARGLALARLSHVATVAALAVAGVLLDAGWLYFAGVVAAAALLAYEHSLVSAQNLSRLNAAFFTMNGVIAVVFGVFVSVGAVVG